MRLPAQTGPRRIECDGMLPVAALHCARIYRRGGYELATRPPRALPLLPGHACAAPQARQTEALHCPGAEHRERPHGCRLWVRFASMVVRSVEQSSAVYFQALLHQQDYIGTEVVSVLRANIRYRRTGGREPRTQPHACPPISEKGGPGAANSAARRQAASASAAAPSAARARA